MDIRINKGPMAYFKGDLEKVSTDFYRVLIVLTAIATVSQFAYDYVLAIKAALIFVVSVFVARESEIFFVTQKASIMRDEAKATLKTTKPEVTALIYALMLPVGTPLFVVAVGSFVSVFIGKMVFGGYSFNVFNPAIVGRLFVGISWPALVTTNFSPIMDNYLLQLIFQKDFTAVALSPLMELHANGIVSLANMRPLTELLFTTNHGMLFSFPVIVYPLVLIFFAVRKTIDFRPLGITLVTSLITLAVIAISFNQSFEYPLFHLLAGGYLFVAILMMTDPFTKPYTTIGTIAYAAIFTLSFTMVRFLGKDSDGVFYALLFANLFVPLINKKTDKAIFGFNRQTVTTLVVTVSILVGTGLFITKILEQRIASKEVTVLYGKN